MDKKICKNCLCDEKLREWVLENAINEDTCSYCGDEENVIDLEDLADFIEKEFILLKYEQVEEEDAREKYSIEDVLEDLDLNISDDEQVIQDLISLFSPYEWYESDYVK